MKALWVVCESIREWNYRLKKRIIYLGLVLANMETLTYTATGMKVLVFMRAIHPMCLIVNTALIGVD